MKDSIRKEIEKLIKQSGQTYRDKPLSVDQFEIAANWNMLIKCQNLSEDFIREFKHRMTFSNWDCISKHQKLSEDFIREFKDEVDWGYISRYQKLSEDLIREFHYKVDWEYISSYQKLSEDFIREFKDKVKWHYISAYQKLSEEFIREFQDKVDWSCISAYQYLSEDFIREFQDKVYWYYNSMYQKLSEEFIKEFYFEMDLTTIAKYQKLSEKTRSKLNIKIPENNWLYKSKQFKLEYIKECTDYEIIDDEYILAYKSVRSDYYSTFNFQYKYEIGKTYTSNCDCNVDNESSFGLSAWKKEDALKYYNGGKLLKVKIPIDKIGAIVHNGNKIRAFELTVIDEIGET